MWCANWKESVSLLFKLEIEPVLFPWMLLFGIKELTTSLFAAAALKFQSNFWEEEETYEQSEYYPANGLISEQGQRHKGSRMNIPRCCKALWICLRFFPLQRRKNASSESEREVFPRTVFPPARTDPDFFLLSWCLHEMNGIGLSIVAGGLLCRRRRKRLKGEERRQKWE